MTERSMAVQQALVIARLRRAMQKIADLPTAEKQATHHHKKARPIMRAHRIAVSALRETA